MLKLSASLFVLVIAVFGVTAPVTPNGICEFLPWLPGCEFFR